MKTKTKIETHAYNQNCNYCNTMNTGVLYKYDGQQVGMDTFCGECGYLFKAMPTVDMDGRPVYQTKAGIMKPKVSLTYNQRPYGCFHHRKYDGTMIHSSLKSEAEFEAAEAMCIDNKLTAEAFFTYYDTEKKTIKKIEIVS